MSEPTFRVAAIEGRHRGGPITSWEQYAGWLEQLAADMTEQLDVDTKYPITESVYRALPRSRQRPAQRAAHKEQRRR